MTASCRLPVVKGEQYGRTAVAQTSLSLSLFITVHPTTPPVTLQPEMLSQRPISEPSCPLSHESETEGYSGAL